MSPVYYKYSALRWTFTLSGAGLSGLVMFVPLMVKRCLLVDICWIFSVISARHMVNAVWLQSILQEGLKLKLTEYF